MINGSQRVIFDPAGTVRLSAVPERGDVLYGISPKVADFYARAHARETFHVVIQEIEVSPDIGLLSSGATVHTKGNATTHSLPFHLCYWRDSTLKDGAKGIF